MADDKQVFLNALVQQQMQALTRYLTRKLGNPDDAAEVAQEAFLKLHRLDQPQTLESPRAFLFQVATNLATDQLRRRQLHFRYLNREDTTQTGGVEGSNEGAAAPPEKILEAREKLATVQRAINSMQPRPRQAFLLHRRSGLSYSAIAREMGVSVSSVEKYILEALQHCRRNLERYYPADDESGQ